MLVMTMTNDVNTRAEKKLDQCWSSFFTIIPALSVVFHPLLSQREMVMTRSSAPVMLCPCNSANRECGQRALLLRRCFRRLRQEIFEKTSSIFSATSYFFCHYDMQAFLCQVTTGSVFVSLFAINFLASSQKLVNRRWSRWRCMFDPNVKTMFAAARFNWDQSGDQRVLQPTSSGANYGRSRSRKTQFGALVRAHDWNSVIGITSAAK